MTPADTGTLTATVDQLQAEVDQVERELMAVWLLLFGLVVLLIARGAGR